MVARHLPLTTPNHYQFAYLMGRGAPPTESATTRPQFGPRYNTARSHHHFTIIPTNPSNNTAARPGNLLPASDRRDARFLVELLHAKRIPAFYRITQNSPAPRHIGLRYRFTSDVEERPWLITIPVACD